MNASQVIFYLISAMILAMGLLAVTARKIFRSAIWLLFSLVGIAALYFWLGVEFVAAVQIVVYVGGIVVLIIFSIFLTQQGGSEMPKPVRKRSVFSLLAVLCGFAFSWWVIRRHEFVFPADDRPLEAGVSNIGVQMLSLDDYGYVLPFEVVSILLLASMVGCIVIAMKEKTVPDLPGKAK